jgi:hypothetical protein
MEWFLKDFVPELNTKNMGNSPSFLTITYKTLSSRRFSSYGILTIDVAAVFYVRTEQRHNRSSISSHGFDRNSRSPEYPFGRQLSHISNGPLDGSKRLAVCVLR